MHAYSQESLPMIDLRSHRILGAALDPQETRAVSRSATDDSTFLGTDISMNILCELKRGSASTCSFKNKGVSEAVQVKITSDPEAQDINSEKAPTTNTLTESYEDCGIFICASSTAAELTDTDPEEILVSVLTRFPTGLLVRFLQLALPEKEFDLLLEQENQGLQILQTAADVLSASRAERLAEFNCDGDSTSVFRSDVTSHLGFTRTNPVSEINLLTPTGLQSIRS
ncbi:hypothetical protein Ccrd_004573 [Cynara cardunculus var. scolymus]|uniref:Uncharacterized protein n=1 Tax=Cynara cardunculus var. scolymus TaxID=59895 RepID=A0A118JVA9_CYNCS|nr:hypothetical protein Ccrd_004573 [Cynara cardunculus var. scolymus]